MHNRRMTPEDAWKTLADPWNDVRRRKDLPRIGQRVLFEMVPQLHSFRFYGERVDPGVVRILLYNKEISWICIARWKDG